MNESIEFQCPVCNEPLDGLDEDLDDPGIYVCQECDWFGPPQIELVAP